MALNRHLPDYRKLDQLVLEGRAQFVATPTTSAGTTPTMVSVPAGQVAIITKIFGLALPGSDTSPGAGDGGSFQVISLYDENGDVTDEDLIFMSFQRVDSVISSPSAPELTWQSSVPCRPVQWEPTDPLVIPPKHTLRAASGGASGGPTTMAGGNFAVYGYMTDVDTARQLGFHTGTQDLTYKGNTAGVGTTTNLLNPSGFRSGALIGDGIATIVPALAGYSVQIIDILARMQPMSGGSTTRTISLIAADSEIGAVLTPVNVMVLSNNNHGDLAEWKASPGIYLPANSGFFALTASGARGSVAVTYRYLKNADVPQDHWWCYRDPQLPTPASGTLGTSSLFTASSDPLSLYYPGLATSATTPGVGKQHVVEGYMVAGQKDATVTSDRLFFALTTGTSAGNLGVDGSGLTTDNYLISPILCLGSHNQNMSLAVDGLNIPCPKDTGAIRLEAVGAGASTATPAAADLDVDEFHLLTWGRTVPARFGTGHFFGGAS